MRQLEPEASCKAKEATEHVYKSCRLQCANLPDPPEKISKLIDKETIAEKGQGQALSITESSAIAPWRQFPTEPHYQKLVEKELLHNNQIGNGLTKLEEIDLNAKPKFP